MGLFLTGPFSFAQVGAPIDLKAQQEQAEAEAKAEADAKAQAEAGIQPEIQEEHDTQKLNKVLKDYNKDKDKVKKDAETIRQMDTQEGLPEDQMGDGPVADPDKKYGPKVVFRAFGGGNPLKKKEVPQDLKKVKYADAVRGALVPFQKLSARDLIKELREKTEGTPTGEMLARFPKLMVFSVGLIKDPDALPGLAGIVDDTQKLTHFSALMICTILLGFFLRALFKKEGRSILAALGFWFLRFFIINSLRLGILLYFYGNEVRPIFEIAKKAMAG